MPCYYFNVRRKGVLLEDPDGEDVVDLAAVRSVVEGMVEDILQRPETYGENPMWDCCTFEITDASGATVMKIPFSEFAEPS